MDSLLIGELSGQAPLSVLLVTVTLPDNTIRWTDGGFVVWDNNIYREVDETFGVVSEMAAFEDGAGNEAASWSLTIMPPQEALATLSAPEAQGSPITVHLGAVDWDSGELIGTPELLARMEFDVPRLGLGQALTVEMECITEEARMLEPNEERIQSDAFHQSIWPGELHYEFQTSAKVKIWWRDDGPKVG